MAGWAEEEEKGGGQIEKGIDISHAYINYTESCFVPQLEL